MKLVEVIYGATLNLGNFESKKVELKYTLDEQESLSEVRGLAHGHFKEEAKASNAKGSSYLK